MVLKFYILQVTQELTWSMMTAAGSVFMYGEGGKISLKLSVQSWTVDFKFGYYLLVSHL